MPFAATFGIVVLVIVVLVVVVLVVVVDFVVFGVAELFRITNGTVRPATLW
jgi:hypothetical protein